MEITVLKKKRGKINKEAPFSCFILLDAINLTEVFVSALNEIVTDEAFSGNRIKMTPVRATITRFQRIIVSVATINIYSLSISYCS